MCAEVPEDIVWDLGLRVPFRGLISDKFVDETTLVG
jgi:hypothetical protein